MIPNALELILNNFKGSTQAVIPDSSDWIRCESELGRSIPEDYKTIINKTGAHSMGRCMLRNPALTSHFSLSRNALLREQLIFGQMAKEMLDIVFYPEIGGWIQLAYVDRELFMLKPTGEAIVWVSLSGWETIETNMTFSEFIWTIFENRHLYGDLGYSIWRGTNVLFGL
jgi:hypothetical protein